MQSQPATTALTRRAAAGMQVALTATVIPARIVANSVVLPEAVDPSLAIIRKDAIERAGAFRSLRRRLAEQNDPRVMLVTSADDEEGKTTCAANLALALAESGHLKVLLVEANLRHPTLAEVFGFRPSHCLLEQLAAHRGQAEAPWQTTEIKPIGLHVLALAPGASHEEVLHGPTFSTATAGWRLAFDYVVVDGPALLASSDASVIHDSMDAVVVVARSGVTRNRTLRRALDLIAADKVAGLVLMDIPT